MPWIIRSKLVSGQSFNSSASIEQFSSAVTEFVNACKAAGISAEEVATVTFRQPSADKAKGLFRLRTPKPRGDRGEPHAKSADAKRNKKTT